MQLFKGHLKEEKGNYSIVVSMQIDGKQKWPQWSTGLPIKGNKTYAQFLLGIVTQNLYEVHTQSEYKLLHRYIQDKMYDAILFEGFEDRLNRRARSRVEKFAKVRQTEEENVNEVKMIHESSDSVVKNTEITSETYRNLAENSESKLPCFMIYCGVDRPEFALTAHTLFYEYLEVWIDHVLPGEIRPTTLYKTQSILRHRDIPFFREYGYRLCDIDDRILKDYYDRMGKGMAIEGTYFKPVKKQTIHTHHAYIKMALNFAVDHSILKYNPAYHVSIKQKYEAKAKTTYTLEELYQLFQIVHGKTCEYPVLMAAYYGLRRSEILGLQWSDINFEKKYIRVQHSLHYIPIDGVYQLYATDVEKSNHSTRTLPLLKPVEAMLLRIREETQRNRFLFRDKYTLRYKDFVFVNSYGKLRYPETVSKNFKSLVIKNGLRYISLHNLRHTVGTLLSEENVNLEKIREWLGHADITTTSKFYLHSNYKSKADTAAVLENLLPDFEDFLIHKDEISNSEKTDLVSCNENRKSEQPVISMQMS